MSNLEYKPRIIDKILNEYLETFGAVCIEGPKWCGKTWTSAYHSRSAVYMGDPAGNFQNKQLAMLNPSLVLSGETPRMIDEWQEVPPLWDAVRYEVDKRGKAGQFILTGSSTPNHKGIMHSGAGRIARLRMRPMSLFESGHSNGNVSLGDICNGKLASLFSGEVDIYALAEYIIRGGWPGNQNTSVKRMGLLPRKYMEAILEEDISHLDGVKRDKHKMELLLKSLARNEAATVSNRKLCADIKAVEDENITVESIASYLDVFGRLFLLDNLKPFSMKLRSSIQVKKAEKRRFVDPSLAASLLNTTQDKLIGDLNTFGFLFESLCERDLRIYAESFGGELYHYQDYNNDEIDAVISLPDGKWCAFEIKLGANQIDTAAKHLLSLKEKTKKNSDMYPPDVLCVICGLSNAAYLRDDGVYVVPITELRN